MRLRLWFAIGIGFLAHVPSAGAADAITVATPSVAISADSRTGTGSIVLIVPGGHKLPGFDYTSAVAATGETIPKANITVTNETPEKDVSATARLVALSIGVTLSEAIPVNLPFSGSVVLFDNPTVSITFTITRHASTGMLVTPSSLTVVRAVGDREARSIQILNTGQSPLSRVRISSSGFTSADGKYEPLRATDAFSVSPGQDAKEVVLPWPRFAGVYSGALDVTADGGLKQSVSTTITTRGPLACYSVPVVLFFAVLLAGYLLSLALENWWSDAAVERLESEVALRRDRSALADTIGQLQGLAPAPQQKATALLARLNASWRQVNDSISDLEQAASANLAPTVAQFATLGTNARTLHRYVDGAVSQGDGEALGKFLESAGSLDLKLDTTQYANALEGALAGALEAERGASMITVPRPRSDGDVAAHLHRVRFLRNTFILVVVALSAFMTIYLAKRDFGTTADYISLFFWSLGLTQAGAQILSKARSAWTK